MKVPIECPIFRAYLQKEIPDAFDGDGLMDTEHKTVNNVRRIDIERRGVSSLAGIEHFGKLRRLDADLNPKIKRLPKLPNTLEVFYLDHKLKTSVQPVFFYNVWNFVMLDNGRVLWAKYSWDNLVEFKTWVSRREDAGKFAKFISECEAYLAKLNPEQSK
jgi:hypothetical protein